MHYLLTTNASIFKVSSRSLRIKRGDGAVSVKFGIKTRKVLNEQYKEQQEYVNQAAEAAYSALNQLDRVNRFKADINLCCVYGEGGSFIEGSTSGGLIYGLSLFNTWWQEVLGKAVHETPIFATGELLSNGQINTISGINIKAQAVLDFTTKHYIDSFVFAYPKDNQSDLSQVLIEALTKQGGKLIGANRIQEVLTGIYDEAYDGDPEGRWEPFKGLASFTYADQHRFFGRDDVIQTILQEIKVAQQAIELVIVSGASGSGKSSVLQAGVIPALEKQQEHFKFQTVKPRDIGEDFSVWLHKQVIETDTNNLWVIDQFEELFTQLELNQTALLDWLQQLKIAKQENENLQIVICIREDFISALSSHFQVFPTTKTVNVPSRLTPDQWRMIIGKQAAYSNLTFEKGLANHIVDEASRSEDNLPLVELLLDELYQRSDKRTLTFNIYRDIGGINGVTTNQAEEAIKNFSEKNLSLYLHQVFQLLIHYQDDYEEVAVSKCTIVDDSTPDTIKSIIESLYEARLLVKGGEENNTYRIAHEVLIKEWPRVQEWLKEDKAFIKWLAEIDRQERRWRESGKLKENLLPKGKPLTDALLWYNKRKVHINRDSREFIQASKGRNKQRQNMALTLFLSVLIIFALITFVSYQKMTEAEVEKDNALINQSRYLIDQAKRALEQNKFNDAILLSLNALPGSYGGKRPYLSEAEEVLKLAVEEDKLLGYYPAKLEFGSEHKKLVAIFHNRVEILNLKGHTEQTFYIDSPKKAILVESQNMLLVTTKDSVIKYDLTLAVNKEFFKRKNSYPELTMSPNSDLLAIKTYPRELAFWSFSKERIIKKTVFNNDVEQVTFSLDGNYLVVDLSNERPKVFNFQRPKVSITELQVIKELGDYQTVGISSKGVIAILQGYSTIVLIDIKNTKVVESFELELDKKIESVSMSKDASLLYLVFSDAVEVFSIKEKETKSSIKIKNPVNSDDPELPIRVSFSKDFKFAIITDSSEQQISIYETETAELFGVVPLEMSKSLINESFDIDNYASFNTLQTENAIYQGVWSTVFDPNSGLFISVTNRLYPESLLLNYNKHQTLVKQTIQSHEELESSEQLRDLKLGNYYSYKNSYLEKIDANNDTSVIYDFLSPISEVVLMNDSRYLKVITEEYISFFDVAKKEIYFQLDKQKWFSIIDFTIHEGLLIGRSEEAMLIWDTKTREIIKDVDLDEYWNQRHFTANYPYFISFDDTNVYVRHLIQSDKNITISKEGLNIERLREAAISGDGQTLIVTDGSKIVSVKLDNDQEVFDFHFDDFIPQTILFSSNGTWVAVSGSSTFGQGKVEVINLLENSSRTLNFGSVLYPSYIGFSHDSRYISLYNYEDVKLYDLASLTELNILSGFRPPSSMSFSDDGKNFFLRYFPDSKNISVPNLNEIDLISYAVDKLPVNIDCIRDRERFFLSVSENKKQIIENCFERVKLDNDLQIIRKNLTEYMFKLDVWVQDINNVLSDVEVPELASRDILFGSEALKLQSLNLYKLQKQEKISKLMDRAILFKDSLNFEYFQIGDDRLFNIVHKDLENHWGSYGYSLIKKEGIWYLFYTAGLSSKGFHPINNIKRTSATTFEMEACLDDCSWWGYRGDIRLDFSTWTIEFLGNG